MYRFVIDSGCGCLLLSLLSVTEVTFFKWCMGTPSLPVDTSITKKIYDLGGWQGLFMLVCCWSSLTTSSGLFCLLLSCMRIWMLQRNLFHFLKMLFLCLIILINTCVKFRMLRSISQIWLCLRRWWQRLIGQWG